MRQLSLKCAITCAAVFVVANAVRGDDDKGGANVYLQHNLVSDVLGAAAGQDEKLVNAWGIDHSPTGPWWVNSNGMGVSVVYDGNGNPAPTGNRLVVTIPGPGGGTSTPTGIVFNGSMDFQLAPTMPALFLFATEDGTISGWNPQVDPKNAVIKVTTPNAVYKGLAIGQTGGHNYIYAANFTGGIVDVFDTNFSPVNLPGSPFHDSNIPADFAPFNVQNIDGSIFVTYAKVDPVTHDDVAGPGNGYVDHFTADGVLMTRFEHGDFLNSPWGVTTTPGGFGKLSQKLLVGNFGSGQIAAFNMESGKFQSMMNGTDGKPITIDGLWGLKFGNGAAAGAADVLYFAAGIDDEAHGLFGTLVPASKSEDK